MRFSPGQLVEIIGTIDTAPDGTAIQTLSLEYIGKLGLIISYNQKNKIYNVLVGNEEDTLEVYEEEVKLVNG